MTDTAIKSSVTLLWFQIFPFTRSLLITLKSITPTVSLEETPHSFIICQMLGFLPSLFPLASFLFIFLVLINKRNLEIWLHVDLGWAPSVWHFLLENLQISFSERKLLGLFPKNDSLHSWAVLLNTHTFSWCWFFCVFLPLNTDCKRFFLSVHVCLHGRYSWKTVICWRWLREGGWEEGREVRIDDAREKQAERGRALSLSASFSLSDPSSQLSFPLLVLCSSRSSREKERKKEKPGRTDWRQITEAGIDKQKAGKVWKTSAAGERIFFLQTPTFTECATGRD